MINATQMLALLGVVLSLIFEFLPGLSDWFDVKPLNVKTAILTGLCAVLGIAAILAACSGIVTGSGAVCPDLATTSKLQLAWDFAGNLIVASGSAQTTYAATKAGKSLFAWLTSQFKTTP